MQARTISERRMARTFGVVAGGLAAAVLVVAFVVANLGLGSEGVGRRQHIQPATSIGVVAR